MALLRSNHPGIRRPPKPASVEGLPSTGSILSRAALKVRPLLHGFFVLVQALGFFGICPKAWASTERDRGTKRQQALGYIPENL